MRVQLLLPAALLVGALTGCGSAEDRSAKYVERAREYMEAEDFVKARLDLRNAVKIDNDNVEARMLLGEIAERNQNYRGLFYQLRQVIAVDPDNVEALVKLGLVQLAASTQNPEMVEEARQNVAAALALAPNDPDALVLEATLMRRDGDVSGAIDQARRVLAEHPENTGAVSLIYSTLKAQGDGEAALAALDEGIAGNPEAIALQLLRVGALKELERWDDVEAGLMSLVEQLPEEKLVRYRLAEFYVDRERLDEAQAVLGRLRDEYPDDASAQLNYAQFLARHRSAADAERELVRLTQAQPEVAAFSFALATLYKSENRTDDAIGVYERIAAASEDVEDKIKAQNELATLYLREDRVDDAKAAIAAVLEEVESDPDALVLRAAIALNEDRTADAVADLRAARRNDPNSERALTLLSQAHLRAGDARLAEERLLDLVAAHPDSIFGRDQLATIRYRAQRFDEVVDLIRAADGAGAAPTPTSMRLLTDSLSRTDRGEEALAVAQELLAGLDESQRPQRAVAHFLIARTLAGLGRPEEALAEYREVEALTDGDLSAELLSAIVSTLVVLDRNEQALTDLDRAIEANPTNYVAMTLKGEVLARDGQLEEARAVLEEALDINPRVWPTYRNLIQVHARLGDADRAVAVARQAIEVDSQPSAPHLILAQLLENQGRYAEAIASYEAVVERNPEALVAVNNLAALIVDHDAEPERLDYAVELARPLRRESNPLFLDTAGWVSYRAGDAFDAVPLLEQAVRAARREPALANQLALLRFHLGMAYAAADRSDDARRELQAAVESGDEFPGLAEAREALARL